MRRELALVGGVVGAALIAWLVGRRVGAAPPAGEPPSGELELTVEVVE